MYFLNDDREHAHSHPLGAPVGTVPGGCLLGPAQPRQVRLIPVELSRVSGQWYTVGALGLLLRVCSQLVVFHGTFFLPTQSFWGSPSVGAEACLPS